MKPFKSFVVTVSKKLSKLCFNEEDFSKKENKDSERHCVRMKSTHGSVLSSKALALFSADQSMGVVEYTCELQAENVS